jgi:hypothetical protein
MPPSRRPGRTPAVVLLAAAMPLGLLAPASAVAATGPSVGPCPLFPANNVWNTDISSLPVNARSAQWIASSGGPSRLIHPDWGPSGGSVPYGIPWQVVDGSHQKVAVTFTYASESDPGPYPLGPDTPIEGGSNSSGDRHALVVDSSTCKLYETWDTHYSPSGSTAGSGAIFSLGSNALRPAGWTSADAAGLPILPGLVRYTEVRSGAIRHAIRFTVSETDTSFIWPARHQAGARSDPTLPPMGARFRLERSVDISHYSADTRVILTAMQHYGLIVADNGSNWYFQGDTDPGWSNEDQVLSELKSIPAGDFEAVDESSLMIDPNSGAARQPSSAVAPPPAATPRPVRAATPSPAPPTPAPPTQTAAPTPLALASAVATPTPATPKVATVRDVAAGPRRGGGVPWALVGAIAAALVVLLGAVVAIPRGMRLRRR